MKKWQMIVTLLFLGTLSWGQIGNGCHNAGSNETMCTNYSSTPTLTQSDNLPNALAQNVWHHILNSPTNLVTVASGYDSSGNRLHLFVKTDGSVVEWKDYWAASNPNTWVNHPEYGTDNFALAIGNGQIWKIQAASVGQSNCTAYPGFHPVQMWNGSAWVNPGTSNACADQISISQIDNAVYIRDFNLGVYYWLGSGFGAAQGGPYASVTAIDTCTALMTDTMDNKIWEKYQCTGSAVMNVGIAPSANSMVLDKGGWFLIGTGAPYLVTTVNNLLKTPTGGFTSYYPPAMDSCGDRCTFGINGGVAYIYPDYALTVSSPLYGNTTCYDGLGAVTPCPTGITHYGTAVAHWAGGSLGGQSVTSPTHTPETLINITAQDTTFDPFICYDGNYQDCVTTTSGSETHCSFIGPIFASGFVGALIESEVAQVRLKWDGNKTGSGCFTHGVGYFCNYNSSSWCTASHNPPDDLQTTVAEVKAIVDASGAPPNPTLFGWDISALCTRYNFLGFHTPWSCADSTKPEKVGVDTLFYGGPRGTNPVDCTYNP